MQFMGMSVAVGDCPNPCSTEEGEAPVSISAHPRQCPAPPASQFDKYQKSTRNENASNFLRCQSSFVSSMQFSPSLSLSCPRGRVLARRQQVHRYRLALARSHWIIPRNAPDRYPSHATWPISVYRHWATTQVALCLQNTETAKD